jgi:hypothetical protein
VVFIPVTSEGDREQVEKQGRQDVRCIRLPNNSHGSQLACLNRLPIESRAYPVAAWWTGYGLNSAATAARTTASCRSRSRTSTNTAFTGTALRRGCGEAVALGFVRVTQQGRAGNGEWRMD